MTVNFATKASTPVNFNTAALLAPPPFNDGYIPMNPEFFIEQCAKQLRNIDIKIQKGMLDQNAAIAQQGAVSEIESMIKTGQVDTSKQPNESPNAKVDSDGNWENQDTVNAISKKIQDQIDAANRSGDAPTAQKLTGILATLHLGDDAKVTAADIKDIYTQSEDLNAGLRSSADINMMRLKQLLDTRQQQVTFASSAQATLAQTTMAIINNK